MPPYPPTKVQNNLNVGATIAPTMVLPLPFTYVQPYPCITPLTKGRLVLPPKTKFRPKPDGKGGRGGLCPVCRGHHRPQRVQVVPEVGDIL